VDHQFAQADCKTADCKTASAKGEIGLDEIDDARRLHRRSAMALAISRAAMVASYGKECVMWRVRRAVVRLGDIA
jgi:hypothetical protein